MGAAGRAVKGERSEPQGRFESLMGRKQLSNEEEHTKPFPVGV